MTSGLFDGIYVRDTVQLTAKLMVVGPFGVARRWAALTEGKVPAGNQVVPMMGRRPSLWFADGERHLRLRASVDDALGRVNPHQLRTYVQRSAAQLIDRFAGDGEADLVAQYADPIPALVFAQLFGCPDGLTARMACLCPHDGRRTRCVSRRVDRHEAPEAGCRRRGGRTARA
ncbi:hypothetical protein ACIBKZ_35445 [Streptomyces sp. NPDC050421]|uniref:hypothetical protein n=1 Tax=unclassified Streptomyces TaxID=2593676 RepID=UPI0037B07030